MLGCRKVPLLKSFVQMVQVSCNSPRATLSSLAKSAGQNLPNPSAMLRGVEAADLRT
jgi:hypothetical protein